MQVSKLYKNHLTNFITQLSKTHFFVCIYYKDHYIIKNTLYCSFNCMINNKSEIQHEIFIKSKYIHMVSYFQEDRLVCQICEKKIGKVINNSANCSKCYKIFNETSRNNSRIYGETYLKNKKFKNIIKKQYI